MSRSESSGFGETVSPSFSRVVLLLLEDSSLCCGFLSRMYHQLTKDNSGRFQPVAFIPPFPTTALPVSGKRRATAVQKRPPKIISSQKFHLHPAFLASIPPRSGPTQVPRFVAIRAG